MLFWGLAILRFFSHEPFWPFRTKNACLPSWSKPDNCVKLNLREKKTPKHAGSSTACFFKDTDFFSDVLLYVGYRLDFASAEIRPCLALTVITQTHTPFPFSHSLLKINLRIWQCWVWATWLCHVLGWWRASLCFSSQCWIQKGHFALSFTPSTVGFSHLCFQQMGTSKCTVYWSKGIIFLC